jgi:N-methylhydantoinase B/oxoprolinase/acetone carboxylase alpha subunit
MVKKLIFQKKTGYKLNKGDKVIFVTGGGGGYGDPQKRKKSSIENDLKQEYLSKDYARKHYNFL